jgi:hypothetical protein
MYVVCIWVEMLYKIGGQNILEKFRPNWSFVKSIPDEKNFDVKLTKHFKAFPLSCCNLLPCSKN